jgi:hypothetical protein
MVSLVIQGMVVPRRRTESASTAGYAVTAQLHRNVALTPDDSEEVITVPAAGSTRVSQDRSFRIEIGGEGDPVGPVEVTVSAPDGTRLASRQLTLNEAAQPLRLAVETVERHVVTPADDPALGTRVTLAGRVVDITGRPVPTHLPVVIWGAPDGDEAAELAPIVITETQPNGYFSAPWPAEQFRQAEGRVAGQGPVPIPLDENHRLPLTVLLVLELTVADDVGACQCDEVPPRAPEPIDLTKNPSAYSQDLGTGCVNLTTPNRTVEEFAYRFVVRTSEPKIKGLTLGVRRTVPPELLGDLLGVALVSDVIRSRAITTTRSMVPTSTMSLDVHTARHLVRSDRPPAVEAVARAAWLSEVRRTKEVIDVSLKDTTGRDVLNGSNPIDWDETPTIHQSVELAFGHVLHMREVWRADGFSLGDLLYSLPLAPGQRRRIAIVDWERRSRSARAEALEFEEHLDAFVGRDRDITEIVGSSLHEETAGGSRSTTWGVAGGIGAGFIGSGFGIFGGVAGGAGGSTSSAWQRSSRSFAADSLQRLRDRVTQRSSAVRDQRSTVVQSVAQGETLRAETEVVANYNRCHALTVEYFEVLRHFLVSHELADVSECLFVPFPLTEFDRGKVLRWREPLRRFLRDRRLANGFIAIRRIADNWVGWEFPEARYSEEAPETLEGEMRISFVLPRPRDDKDGQFQIDMWRPWRGLLPVDTLELWTANLNQRTALERDRYFRTEVAPQIAERLVQRLRFAYVTNRGGEIEVPLDPTLVSRYVEGVPLYLIINPRGTLPSVPREDIAYFKVWYDGEELPPDARVIVHSSKMRYRCPHSTDLLFASDRVLDDLRAGDPVVIPTPVSRRELRNPRAEDRDLADRLGEHLNEHLEYYHQAIWANLDAQRRYMLLDSILVPGLAGRSVASVCSNELIGIVGNSLVLPVAPGQRLDPTVDTGGDDSEPVPLIDAYNTNPLPPIRVSVPTRGVYAEAIPGECNACELIDDARYWRWSTDGLLEPPEIAPVSTESRATNEPDLTPTPLPTPLVSIQNAPAVPAPAALADAFGLLATRNLFTDITGLEGTQKNAMAAFEASMAAASALGAEASKLASQNELGRNAGRMLDRIDQARKDNLLTSSAAQELSRSVLQGLIGESRPKDAPPTNDDAVKKVVDEAAQSSKAQIKVSSPTETVEVNFDDDTPAVGAAAAIGRLDLSHFVSQDVIQETPDFTAPPGSRAFTITARTRELSSLGPVAHSVLTSAGFIRVDPADGTKFQLVRNLRIVYPADPKNTKKLRAGGRFPVVVIVHGNHPALKGGRHVPSYEGYTYLQEELARHGIVSVSVDTNVAYFVNSLIEMRAESVIGALDTMRAMDRDATSRFHNRLDFDKVGMIGHSRGGDAVVRATILNAARPAATRFGVKAVCSLAPTDFTGTAVPAAVNRLNATHAGFYLVVYGGLDGDVAGFDGATGPTGTGFRHYDRANLPKAMVFLDECSHNRFNDVWSTDERGILPADAGRLVSRPDHRTLANEYIGGMFRWQLLGTLTPRNLLDGTSTNSVKAKVSVQWSVGKMVTALDSFENPATPDVGNRTLIGASVSNMASVVINGTKLEERTNHQTNVLVVAPNVPGPPPEAYKLTLPATHRNWTGFDQLTFRVCADADVSTAAKTAASPLPDFTLVLTDTAGGSAVINASALRVPNVRPRLPVFHSARNPRTGASENCTVVRLETLAVDLASISGVDRTKMAAIALVPPVNFSVHQFFDSIQLVKR